MRKEIWKCASHEVGVRYVSLALLMATGLISGSLSSVAQADNTSDSSQPAKRDYRFEVASIRPVGPPTGHEYPSGVIPPSYTPGRYRQEKIYLGALAAEAFGVKHRYQIEYPSWMSSSSTYGNFAVNATLPEGATKADLPIMIRHLLEDRFALKYHHETKQMSGYELVVAKSGLKLAKSATPDFDGAALSGRGIEFKDGAPVFAKEAGSVEMCFSGVTGGCALHGRNRMMQNLAADLAGRLHTPVRDATGLEGGYDYTVIFTDEFVMTLSGVLAPVTDTPDEPLAHPLLHEALKEQLGLELRPVKNVPVDVVIIDSANREPTEN